MKRTSKYITTIQCDVPGCTEKFHTGSVASMARVQMLEAHPPWYRLKLRVVFPDWKKREMGSSGSRLLDVCPIHKPAPRMMANEQT